MAPRERVHATYRWVKQFAGMRIRIRRVSVRVGEVDRPPHRARGRSGRRFDPRVARREPREDRFGTRLTLLGSEGRLSRQSPGEFVQHAEQGGRVRGDRSPGRRCASSSLESPRIGPPGAGVYVASPEARRDRAFRHDARLQAGPWWAGRIPLRGDGETCGEDGPLGRHSLGPSDEGTEHLAARQDPGDPCLADSSHSTTLARRARTCPRARRSTVSV